MTKPKELDLPFDQYSRQIQALRLLDFLRKDNQSFTILDVGGYKGATTDLHKNDKVTVLDVFDIKEKGYVKGSGLNMPFEDSSFDFVVSFDVFEHIKENDRDTFVAELCRVSKIGTIIAAPIKTPQTQLAENALNDLFTQLHGKKHPWLAEHIDYGLPAMGQVRKSMDTRQLTTFTLYSNDVRLWLAMQGIIFTASKFPEMSKLIKDLNSFYNQQGPFDGSKEASLSYRHIVVGLKNEQDAEKTKRWTTDNYHTLRDETALKIENKITVTYLAALTTMRTDNDKLINEVRGYQHACNELSKTIHQLQAEVNRHNSSVGKRVARKFSRTKKRILHGSK